MKAARTLIRNLGSQAKAAVCTWKEASGPFWPEGTAAASHGRQDLIPVDVKIRREADMKTGTVLMCGNTAEN